MRKVMALLLILSGAGCAQSGFQQQELQSKIRSDYVSEKKAVQSFMAGNDKNVVSSWRANIASVEAEKTGGAEFYTNLRYMDLARLRSHLGWSMLTSGNMEGARKLYDQAFRDIYEGEQGHRNAIVLDNQAREQQLQFMLAYSSQLSAYGANSTIRNASGALNSFMSSQGSISDAAAAARTPRFFDDPDNVETDGVRINVLPSIAPLTNIGRFRSETGWCTASLVGYRIAVTNSHCVSKGNKAPGAVWKYTDASLFELIFESVETQDLVRVKSIAYSDDNIQLKGWKYKDWANDWALLILDRHPVNRGYLGIVADSANLKEGDDVFLAGYSHDQNDGRYLSMHWRCKLKNYSAAEKVLHDSCRSAPGSSGSPMLLADGTFRRFYIYGLHAFVSGQVKAGEKTAFNQGGGPAANQFIGRYRQLVSQLAVPGES